MHRSVRLVSLALHVALCVVAVYVALAAPDPPVRAELATALRLAAEPERSLVSPIRVSIVALLLFGLIVHTRTSRQPWR